MESNKLVLSPLGHTWIFDIDGTICKHNGYKIEGRDTLLPGVKDFFAQIPEGDMIIFVTSRTDEYQKQTIEFLRDSSIRYDYIIFNAPYGERILVNDDKPSGLKCSVSINLKRDDGHLPMIETDLSL